MRFRRYHENKEVKAAICQKTGDVFFYIGENHCSNLANNLIPYGAEQIRSKNNSYMMADREQYYYVCSLDWLRREQKDIKKQKEYSKFFDRLVGFDIHGIILPDNTKIDVMAKS